LTDCATGVIDCKQYGYAEVVGGNPEDAKCTSIGGSMRRYHVGLKHNTPDGLRTFEGGLYGSKADNPQQSNFLSTVETATATTPCKQCMILGKNFQKINLSLSYTNHDNPPATRRTSTLHCEQCKEINNSNHQGRTKLLAQTYGYHLDEQTSTVPDHYAKRLPGGDGMLMDNVTIEIAHDGLLGTWPLQVYLNTFYMVRDPQNPNYLGPKGEAVLNARWTQFGWKGSLRSHIPPPFKNFKGRSATVGKKLFGSAYRKGMPVPKQADPFKWTAAMSFVVLVHIVAVLSPLIKDHNCPIWKNLLLHQRWFMGMLKWSATVREIFKIDQLVRQHNKGDTADCFSYACDCVPVMQSLMQYLSSARFIA
jgi:hypothetical protein